MFSNVRAGSQVYVLYKDTTPHVETGTVVSVTPPVPKFPVANFMSPQEFVLDMVVKVGGNNVTLQKLPSNLDVADQGLNGNMVITTTREAMNNEVNALRQKSLAVLNSVDYHKKIIQDCDGLLQKLNPEYAEQRQQKEDIDSLKTQMSEMMASMKELMAQIKTTKKEDNHAKNV